MTSVGARMRASLAHRTVDVALALVLGMAAVRAQTPPDPWMPLRFLEGTWEAKGQGAGGASSVGRYAFRRELGGHVLARRSASGACSGPADFDCDHSDLFYVYQDAPGGPLKAIYFDNEGHVIRYGVATPEPGEVVFLSEPAPGPRFRLAYERRGDAMTGRFQMQPPGQDAWQTYLEWSGAAISGSP